MKPLWRIRLAITLRGVHARPVVLFTLALRGAVAVSVVLPLIAAPSVPAAQATPVPTATTQGKRAAQLSWTDCPLDSAPTRQCAFIVVPRNYAKKNGRTVTLAMARIPATGSSDQRLGSLFFNPGGPGGAGVPLVGAVASVLDSDITSSYDIVSWDPRGVGASKPALEGCGQPWPDRPARNAEPNWNKVAKRSRQDLTAANNACQQNNRHIINHIGTNNVVRDLDQMRKAVGDPDLHFWGMSYGTRIGYVYAIRYPDRVGRFVLDGNINPDGDYLDLSTGGVAQDMALRFIRNNDPAVYDAIMAGAAELTSDPIDLGDGLHFNRWDWLDVTGGMIAAQANWPVIPSMYQALAVARTDTAEGQAARSELLAQKSAPNTNEGQVFSAVNCIDYGDRPTASEQKRIIWANASAAPVFGGSLTTSYAIGCEGLNLRADPVPAFTPRNRERVAKLKVVVANSTADASTPMFWARKMARGFAKSSMIRYRSGQHVIWHMTRSECVNDPIDDYVLTGRRPASRTCAFVPPETATAPAQKLLASR